MFKKLLKGDYGFAQTFWKYGVLGLLLLSVINRFAHALLYRSLNGANLMAYYTRYFTPLKFDSAIITYTVVYVASSLLLVFYSISILLAVWNSSADYDKSIWLRYISRLFIFGAVYMCLSVNL